MKGASRNPKDPNQPVGFNKEVDDLNIYFTESADDIAVTSEGNIYDLPTVSNSESDGTSHILENENVAWSEICRRNKKAIAISVTSLLLCIVGGTIIYLIIHGDMSSSHSEYSSK